MNADKGKHRMMNHAMTAFSPSPQFTKRWHATPIAIKNAFHQELDDIIDMLHGSTPAHEFEFNHADFGQTIEDLLFIHKDDTPVPARIIHNLENPQALFDNETPKPTQRLHPKDLDELEARITEKLSRQIDDFLGEHMAQVSDDLKGWLKTALKNELANHQ